MNWHWPGRSGTQTQIHEEQPTIPESSSCQSPAQLAGYVHSNLTMKNLPFVLSEAWKSCIPRADKQECSLLYFVLTVLVMTQPDMKRNKWLYWSCQKILQISGIFNKSTGELLIFFFHKKHMIQYIFTACVLRCAHAPSILTLGHGLGYLRSNYWLFGWKFPLQEIQSLQPEGLLWPLVTGKYWLLTGDHKGNQVLWVFYTLNLEGIKWIPCLKLFLTEMVNHWFHQWDARTFKNLQIPLSMLLIMQEINSNRMTW